MIILIVKFLIKAADGFVVNQFIESDRGRLITQHNVWTNDLKP